ncbi:mucin (plasmid) [Opitutaceae bacterium TAV5]|nr:mucin [Opitutaceae bacterium TAV5]
MLTQKIEELTNLRLRIAQLGASIEKERTAELSALPGQYGYANVNDFIKALTQVAGGNRGKRAKKTFPANSPQSSDAKRTRATITPEIREQVKAAVLEGKTGTAIATALGISVQSVQKIKKAFGLVNAPAPGPATS